MQHSNGPPSPQFVPVAVTHQAPSPRPVQPGEVPPGRVQVAMEFLGMLTYKTAPRAAVCDNQIQQLDRDPLTKAELNAQATACNLLNDYFNGKLRKSPQERTPPRYHDDCEVSIEQTVGPGVFVHCINCRPGTASPSCRLCRGSGNILILPASEGDVE